ncbi:NAD(P)-dependent oxidoreductase [Chitinophaga ginsengisoli]|uniref:Putative NADH-flavin reductase n=1 Tax=Chitinophaga ginsengisoli TaxID=363837 RepID=A0A2P8G517_9BACT|nr:NAD(P)H-binding protein [Chitinophaga ginsengisoli]PSL29063.1 putative NADH-flavin reductase [Chitinophaga ginsengisoli]
MKTHTTIAVVGGTGKSGQYLVKQLLQQNFALRLLVRDHAPIYLNDPKITVIRGDARDITAVKALVAGADAVISTIGQRGNDLPIFSAATANIIRAMQEQHIQRYLVTTGLSVNTLMDQKSPWVMQATDWMYAHYPQTTNDKQAEYELLQNTGLDWTLIRLPLIELTNDAPNVTASLIDCPSNKISAASLATFLIGQLSDNTFSRAAPFIASVA